MPDLLFMKHNIMEVIGGWTKHTCLDNRLPMTICCNGIHYTRYVISSGHLIRSVSPGACTYKNICAMSQVDHEAKDSLDTTSQGLSQPYQSHKIKTRHVYHYSCQFSYLSYLLSLMQFLFTIISLLFCNSVI